MVYIWIPFGFGSTLSKEIKKNDGISLLIRTTFPPSASMGIVVHLNS
jgi:hypothetical protein